MSKLAACAACGAVRKSERLHQKPEPIATGSQRLKPPVFTNDQSYAYGRSTMIEVDDRRIK